MWKPRFSIKLPPGSNRKGDLKISTALDGAIESLGVSKSQLLLTVAVSTQDGRVSLKLF